jgi:hypothetical protein
MNGAPYPNAPAEPEFGIHADGFAKANGGVGGDAATTFDDVGKAAGRIVSRLGQPILRDAAWFQKLLQEDRPRVRNGDQIWGCFFGFINFACLSINPELRSWMHLIGLSSQASSPLKHLELRNSV